MALALVTGAAVIVLSVGAGTAWAWFRRTPDRAPDDEPAFVVAPCDGTVDYAGASLWIYTLEASLSFWDTHVVYSPVDGFVRAVVTTDGPTVGGDVGLDPHWRDGQIEASSRVDIVMSPRLAPRQTFVVTVFQPVQNLAAVLPSFQALVAAGADVDQSQAIATTAFGTRVRLVVPATLGLDGDVGLDLVGGVTCLRRHQFF